MSSVTNQAEAFEVCRQWVEQATGADTDHIRQPVADAARAQKPYNIVDWPTDEAVGATPYERVGDPIDPDPGTYDHTLHRYERRRGIFRVEAFGDSAFDRLIGLRSSLRDVLNKKFLRDAGVAVQVIGGPTDTSAELDTTWEERAIVDFSVLYVHQTENPVAVIEHVTVNAELEAYPDDPAPYEDSFTIDLPT